MRALLEYLVQSKAPTLTAAHALQRAALSVLRRAASALVAWKNRDLITAVKEWEKNIALAREREKVEEMIESTRQMEEPMDQVPSPNP